MNNYITGINENQLQRVIQHIQDNIDKIESRFENIDKINSDLKLSYNSPSASSYFSKYNDLKVNYEIIKNNLLSYKNDLINVLESYRKLMTTAVDKVDTFKLKGSIDEERKSE